MDDLQGLLAQFQPTEEDRRRARQQALMAASLSLLGRPKGAEYQSFGQAGLLGMGLYNQALGSIPEQKMHAMQAATQAMAFQEKARQFKDADQEREILRNANVGTPSTSDSVMPAQVSSGLSAKRQQQALMLRYAAAAQQAGRPDLVAKYQDAAAKLDPVLDKEEPRTLPNGQRVMVKIYKDGGTEIVPLSQYGPDLRPLHWVDNGASIQGRDDLTGEARTSAIQKSLTPDAMLSSETARRGQDITVRGQNMTDARARELNALARQQAADARDANQWETNMATGLQVNKRTGESRPITSGGNPIGSEPMRKATEAAPRALAVIDQAEGIIKDATGSYAGAAIDQAARAVGIATPGAEAIAKLQALEGALMMAQPRMEGQQSDRDAILYRQMAGQIGNPTVPQSAKLAALKELRKLHEKYAHIQQPSQPAKNDPLGIR